MNRHKTWAPALIAICGLAWAPGAAARPVEWAVYGGVYDTEADEQPTELGAEVRFPPLKIPKVTLRPAAGVAGTEDGNAWAYGGVRLELSFNRWVITPQFAVTLYDQGDDGRDLGGPLEFRSGLEVAYDLARGPKVGLLFYHLSNAGLYEFNPGSNSLVLTLSFR